MPLNDFSFLFDDNPNPMWIYELSSLNILKVNKAAINHYGYSEQEFLSMTIRDLRAPSQKEKLDVFMAEKVFAASKSNRMLHSGVWEHVNKNGDSIHTEISSHAIKFRELDCRMVVATDATEKLLYQEEAIGAKNSLEALINNTEDQIWSVDVETRYVYMNRAYRTQVAHLTGIEPKEGQYSFMHNGYKETIIEDWKKYYSRALDGERYIIINETCDPETQKLQSFEISFNPIYKVKGEITGVGCFARNITERLETEKAIRDQNERLRNIASLTSHELRRPVASMMGLINVMDRINFFNPDNKEIIEHILTVSNEIDEVIRLIVDKTFMDNLPSKYPRFEAD